MIPPGGLPPQSSLLTGRAIFTTAYAVIPQGVMSDIVTSVLPGWSGTRVWMLARPMTGFAETFSQYLMEIAPGGGSDTPEPEAGAEGVIFVTGGQLHLTLEGAAYTLSTGSYAYLAPGANWQIKGVGEGAAHLHWIRKLWDPAPGLTPPKSFVTSEAEAEVISMPGTDGGWTTTRFVDPEDLAHDMHVNIVTLRPGSVIPFEETHVMEHGLYVLDGKAVYNLNQDWVEVTAGDFMWLRAFCPQCCYAGGPGPFRYLLYKDVNRHPKLRPGA